MRKLFLAACGLVFLAGCATSKDYQLYAETQQKIAQANAMAETARYAALAEIAKSADPGARVAAVMSLNFGASTNGPRPQMINPPKSFGDTALQWTSALLPSLTQFYGISANRQIAVTQSNNQAAIATSTNNTFAAMSNNMATSNAAIANSGLAAATTISGQGTTALNNIVTNNNATINSMNQTNGTTITNLVNTIPQLQPNITTTTTTTNSSAP